MTEETTISAAELGAGLQSLAEKLTAHKPKREPVFLGLLREHFQGAELSALPIVRQSFKPAEHPNIQAAVDSYLEGAGRSHELFGINGARIDYEDLGLADLVARGQGDAMEPGPVAFRSIAVAADRFQTCVHAGLFLIRSDEPLAVLLIGPDDNGLQPDLRVEVMGAPGVAEAFLGALRELIRELSVYRGQVISLASGSYGSIKVEFRTLRAVARDQIILPEGLLERVERHSIGFSKHAQRLRAAGRHLKRGLLLYGPPGTGKTMTAMYLARSEPGRTVFLLAGHSLSLLSETCAMARLLQPATIIIEDVDLIAEARGGDCSSSYLFELLNQMDGLAEDADILFLLTTNRPEAIEPAIKSRPGRIDEALEVPRPDAACRGRLLTLYSQGMRLELEDRSRFIQRTEGVSAAFIRELLRKAALAAAEGADGPIVVGDKELDQALRELTLAGGALTRSFLGAEELAAD